MTLQGMGYLKHVTDKILEADNAHSYTLTVTDEELEFLNELITNAYMAAERFENYLYDRGITVDEIEFMNGMISIWPSDTIKPVMVPQHARWSDAARKLADESASGIWAILKNCQIEGKNDD